MSRRASRNRRSHTLPLFARVLLALVLMLSLGWTAGLSPSPASAAGIAVTTTADLYDLLGVDCPDAEIADLPGKDGLVSIREAICAANNTAGDDDITFSLTGSAPWTITLEPEGPLRITANLTITGPGPNQNSLVIDADRNSRIFVVDSPAIVEISTLTITGGFTNGVGGGIDNSGDLTLTDVTVTDNIGDELSTTYGGGIFNSGSLMLSGTTVSANTATYGGGIANSGTLHAEDSIINGNTAVTGGGVFNDGATQLTRTTISGNVAATTGEAGGGGISSGISIELDAVPAAEEPVLELQLFQSVVSNNSGGIGGGIFVVDGDTRIQESTVDNNEACTGGGIATATTVLRIHSSTISNNRATGGQQQEGLVALQITCSNPTSNGGGVYATGPIYVFNSTISGNSADDAGGGIYLRSTSETEDAADISFSTITGNTADADDDQNADGGGGVFNNFVESSSILAAVNGVSFGNSIVAGNTGAAGQEDCGGPTLTSGYNLFGEETGCPDDAVSDLFTDDITEVLDTTLDDNGGPTKTHALIPDSPAIDNANDEACDTDGGRDQRGVSRLLGEGCDIGAFELEPTGQVMLTVQTEGTGTVAASPSPASSSGTANNMTYLYPAGTVVTLTATPGSGQTLARWTIDDAGNPPYGKGWASPLTITLDEAHTAKATFIAKPIFNDVPTNHTAYEAISELGARTIAQGFAQPGCAALGTTAPCYGPNNLTVRAESATFLTRLLGLQGENHGNGGFTDIAEHSPTVQQAIGTMKFYGIFEGYGDGRFGPNDKITHTEMVLVISRAMVFQGYWTRATVDAPAIYPNLNLTPDARLDLVTFVQNAGNLPGFANNTPRAPVDQPAPRAWTAQALWQALDMYFGVDEEGKGGYVP